MHFSNDENHQTNAWDEHLDPGYVSQDVIRNQIGQQNLLPEPDQKSCSPETVDSGDHFHKPERRPLQNRVFFQCPQPFLYKICLLGSCVASAFGRLLGLQRTTIVTTMCVSLSFILSLIAFYEVALGASACYIKIAPWIFSEMFDASWSFFG